MRNSILPHLLVATMAVAVAFPLAGCGKEKRLKECVDKCETLAKDCANIKKEKKEEKCEERAKKCGEECQKLE